MRDPGFTPPASKGVNDADCHFDIACSDPSSLAADLAAQYKSPHYAEAADFLKSLKSGGCLADAAILATPTHTHASLAKDLVAEGLAVLVEKPLAANGAEGRDLIESHRSSNKGLIMVGHHRRHNSYAMTVRNMIKEGQLGKIVAVNGGLLLLPLLVCNWHGSRNKLLTFTPSLGYAQANGVL